MDKNGELIKKPQLLIVEYANNFFKSVWAVETMEPNKQVVTPIIIKKTRTKLFNWNIKKNFIIKKIPAEISVAECISAEAGAGASIESGNQKWKPSCADLHKIENESENTKK